MRIKILYFIILFSLLVNGILTYKLFTTDNSQTAAQENLPFLSKRIFAENQNDILINFIPLRQALRDYVEKQDKKVSVYFEYLPSGTSIGVNDKEESNIVSLAKVPLIMAIYKKIERDTLSLKDTLVIKKENIDSKSGTLWKKGEGTKLSVGELIKLALVESDNTASLVLFEALTPEERAEVYDGLDISLSEEGKYLLISPKNYSSIFRSLYLSSFISEENSNKILEILTQTLFNNKIVAGVPKGIKVSHKIGIFNRDISSPNLFSDCGIIYVPNRPYILCAFVLDTDEQAKKHISFISKMIYGYVVNVKGGK